MTLVYFLPIWHIQQPGASMLCVLRKIKEAVFIDLLGIETDPASSYPTQLCLFFFFFFKTVWSYVFKVKIVLYDQVLKYNLILI